METKKSCIFLIVGNLLFIAVAIPIVDASTDRSQPNKGDAYFGVPFTLFNIMRDNEGKANVRHDGKSNATSTSGSYYKPVYIGPQDGMMEKDKIVGLPGQPEGITFDQYAGYVTVDASHGRALFYYLAEAKYNASSRPLQLWLGGGPGSSGLATLFTEHGPFRIKNDTKTLYENPYAWNNVANIMFMDAPAGVGFSYSNTSSDYDLSGDKLTAEDSYTFLVNWLDRFPQYKTRELYIMGQSYSGHYVPQLAQLILTNNKITNQTVINLKGIAVGNPGAFDYESDVIGTNFHYWSHALISDELYHENRVRCTPQSLSSEECLTTIMKTAKAVGGLYVYNPYYPLCYAHSPKYASVEVFDHCSLGYVPTYLDTAEVQRSIHAISEGPPRQWVGSNFKLLNNWGDSPSTMLPVIQALMSSGIRVWIYSGDLDVRVPITSIRMAINKLKPVVETPWYHWYFQRENIHPRSLPRAVDPCRNYSYKFSKTFEEIGGYVVGYQNLTFVTVLGAGHGIGSHQPAKALTLFSSFIDGKLPPSCPLF